MQYGPLGQLVMGLKNGRLPIGGYDTEPGRFIAIPKGDLDGARYLQLISGIYALPVVCTGCAIQVITRSA